MIKGDKTLLLVLMTFFHVKNSKFTWMDAKKYIIIFPLLFEIALINSLKGNV